MHEVTERYAIVNIEDNIIEHIEMLRQFGKRLRKLKMQPALYDVFFASVMKRALGYTPAMIEKSFIWHGIEIVRGDK